MTNKANRFLLIALIMLCILNTGCSSTDSSSSDNEDTVALHSGEIYTLDCGVVKDGLLQNPIDPLQGEEILGISFIDSRSAIVDILGGQRLVQLLGLADQGFSPSAIESLLNSFASRKLYLFRESEGCSVTFEGGGLGTKGNIVTANGVSLVEEVIRSGNSGDIVTSGTCGEAAIASCYVALQETFTPERPVSAGEMRNFLWKPRAESTFNFGLPIIHVNPSSDVYVNGEIVKDFGPGNGRAVTARLFRNCSAYAGAKVEVFQPGTRIPYTHNGLPYVIISNPCDRLEFD
ncbi:MAG: hypothetical protein SGJ02_02885 [bacterium]|nr:hypothetical protein [bacterium]